MKMFIKKKFNFKKKIKELYFNEKNLQTISNMEHLIGLHSITIILKIEL